MADMENYRAPEMIKRWGAVALGVGAIGLLLWLVGTAMNPEQGLRSWLLAFMFWGGLSVGSLGLLMLQYLTGGAWGVVIRRGLEAGTRTYPLIILFFVPLAIGVYKGWIYSWTHLPPEDPVMIQRGIYMTSWFWIVRGIFYFALFTLMITLLNKWSKAQDETTTLEGAAKYLDKASRFSGPMLVIYTLVVTFAAVDWTLALEPHWFSTMWGLLYVVGWALNTLCFMVVLMSNLIETGPMSSVLGKRHFHDLGKLMLALVMVWAYFNFSQFLIIWAGNLPEETTFYLPRMAGGFGWIGVGLILFHFAFPFLVLLQQDFKRRWKWLAGIAIFVMFMRLVDLFWQIGPTERVMPTTIASGAFHIDWLDLVAPIAIGGIWLWFFFNQLAKRPIVPYKDPFFEGAIEHGHGH